MTQLSLKAETCTPCVVELYTHKIKGPHENGFILAAKIDALMKV